MTPQEINKAIGETVGTKPRILWLASRDGGKSSLISDEREEFIRSYINNKRRDYPGGAWSNAEPCKMEIWPDYYGDLNASRTMEGFVIALKITNPTAWRQYCDHLAEICESLHQAIHATSQQRSKAFLIWCGKWRDE